MPCALACAALSLCTLAGAEPPARDYRFDSSISRPVLENYLSRCVTAMDLLTGVGNVDDNLRALHNMGVKYAGRVIYRWGSEQYLPAMLPKGREIAERIHAVDPDVILQAGVFEIVTRGVEALPIPEWVFTEFGLPVERRNFDYDAMLFPDGRFRDHWCKDGSVPDMCQLETRMWFVYAAASYIDIGCEAIHFGQVHLIGANDHGWRNWWDMLSRVRRYAATHARRHLVLCDAHTHGLVTESDKLLFDLHAYPLRIRDIPDQPQEAELAVGYIDSLFGKSLGGITPSGWRCDSLPYIVEFDNWGVSDAPGTHVGDWWTWGWDEICWLAHQPVEYRNAWLRYAQDWIRATDPSGFLQMPMSRCLCSPVNGLSWYLCNTPSEATPDGFDQEETIKDIWAHD